MYGRCMMVAVCLCPFVWVCEINQNALFFLQQEMKDACSHLSPVSFWWGGYCKNRTGKGKGEALFTLPFLVLPLSTHPPLLRSLSSHSFGQW